MDHFIVGTIFPSLLPLCGHGLHGLPHERVDVEDGVEVVDAEREDVAVGLGAHARHPARVRQQADLAEVGAVGERGGHLAVAHDDVDDALLDEVHLGADRTLLDDDVACRGLKST